MEKSIYEVGRNSPLGPLDPLPSPKGWAAVPTSCCGIVRSSSGDNTKRRVCSPTVAAPSAVRVRRWQLTCPSATDRPAGLGGPWTGVVSGRLPSCAAWTRGGVRRACAPEDGKVTVP